LLNKALIEELIDKQWIWIRRVQTNLMKPSAISLVFCVRESIKFD